MFDFSVCDICPSQTVSYDGSCPDASTCPHYQAERARLRQIADLISDDQEEDE